ncbi:MAG: hypothetical protein F6K62_10200 [Sphaerospermopsis sp. SIO1G2]|nr:hypothetical protein [Sphaerospermopsis sp. SIO1G2]
MMGIALTACKNKNKTDCAISFAYNFFGLCTGFMAFYNDIRPVEQYYSTSVLFLIFVNFIFELFGKKGGFYTIIAGFVAWILCILAALSYWYYFNPWFFCTLFFLQALIGRIRALEDDNPPPPPRRKKGRHKFWNWKLRLKPALMLQTRRIRRGDLGRPIYR